MPIGDYTKTAYAEDTGITPARLNNNEDKTKELDTVMVGVPLKTTAALVYRVATTGNDSNTGLTEGQEFATIQHAIDVLPKIINHVCTILIVNGTYTEDVSIKGFSGAASIVINGLDADGYTACMIKSVTIENNQLEVNITNLRITGTGTSGAALFITKSIYCTIATLNIVDSALSATGILVNKASRAYISACVISNRDRAITCHESTIYVNANTGTGNNIGLLCGYGGIIAKSDVSQPAATTAEMTLLAGQIKDSKRIESGTVSLVLTAPGTAATVDATFDNPFSSPPKVVIGPQASTLYGYVNVDVYDVSTTIIRFIGAAYAAQTIPIDWIAIGS